MKVAFLDRDGTLNIDYGYVHKPEDVELVSGAKQALHKLIANDYELILVTNQSGIGRGFFTEEQLHETNERLQDLLELKFLKIYFCPYHPQAKVLKYRKVSSCRKPEPGMILQAFEDFPQIDREQSLMIGDSIRDVEAGISAGLKRNVLLSDVYELRSYAIENHLETIVSWQDFHITKI
ncbi:MAG: HAD family hydrolase [bacterium]|nr:HAD family hydrolase [bacterium]